jgi:hypothetical protein
VRVTLRRLFLKNKVDHVICVGSTEEEEKLCTSKGAEFLTHANKPLGKKWNYGFLKAKEYRPEFIVYVGSSDWLSDNYLPAVLPLAENIDMIGKPDFNMLHIGSKLQCANWPGYASINNSRAHEPIGAGRILRADFLDKINWQPFDDYLNMAMDYSMYQKLLNVGGSLMMFNSPEIQILSVSCDLWGNMHNQDFNKNVINFRDPELWLKTWFPEALELNGLLTS